jgi:tetratricopeptide (TPR) repeat protein
MRIALDSAGKKRAFCLLLLGLTAIYLILVSARFAAEWLAARPYLRSLRTAVQLDPGNAEYRHRLGRYYDLVLQNPNAAIEQYQSAVRLNPHDARYWLELADAYQVMGDSEKQAAAIEKAIQADPTTPNVAWEAANLYLVQGVRDKALQQFGIVLRGAPNMFGLTIQLCWRVVPDADVLLREVIPAQADAYLEFLHVLTSKQDTAAAMKVWDALIRLRQPMRTEPVFNYLGYLLRHKEPDEAIRVWRQAASPLGLNSYLPSSSNLIVNGDFHLNVLNAGFDWQYHQQPSVSLILDTSDFHAGERSLAITFDGHGVEDAGIYQLVAVEPSTRYEFSGYYKNGEIDGAGGPHFAIRDLYSSKTYFLSDELKYGSSWRNVTGEFTTDADTKIVILHVPRLPAGGAIRGKLWIDDFRLVKRTAVEEAVR